MILDSLRSAFVHSRRLTVFLAALAFFKSIAPVDHEAGCYHDKCSSKYMIDGNDGLGAKTLLHAPFAA